MTITTIRPTSTSLNTMTLTGAGSAHAALNDNNDGSYLTATYAAFSEAILGFSGYSTPSGSTIKQVRVRVRYVTVPSGAITSWYVKLKSGHYGGFVDSYQSIAGPTPVDASGAWHTTNLSGGTWTDADVNALVADIYPGLYTGNVQMPRIFEIYLDIETNANPTAAITSPGNPVTTTTRPPLVFTYSDPDSDPMEAYRVRLFTSAQYGAGGFDPNVSTALWDSGRVSATSPPASVTLPIDLTNGASYRYYIWVYQQGADTGLTGQGVSNSTSLYIQFTMSVTPPAVPTISSVLGSGTTIIQVTVGSGGGTPATSTIAVERSSDGGTTWTPIRYSPTGIGTIFDYEAPLNKPIIHRAKAFTSAGVAGSYSASTSPITITDNDWHLKNPFLYTQAIVLNVIGTSMKTSKPQDKAFFSPLGRTKKMSIADVIKGEEGSLVVDFLDAASYQAFLDMRAATPVLLLQRGWTSDQWYVSLGENVEIELFNYTPTYRTISFSWTEVDNP